MRRPALILAELGQIGTIADLTTVFEGIASMEIAKIRDQTLASKNYFHELWTRIESCSLWSPRKVV